MKAVPPKRFSSRTPDSFEPKAVRSVLAAVDLGPNSDRVLGRVSLLPLAAGARVTILHVVPDGLRPHELRDAQRDAHKALASEAKHLRRSLPATVGIQTLVEVGTPLKNISACAKKEKADLIVMGRGGGRVLREAFLGSTAERIVRQTRLPVLVVRRPPRQAYCRPTLALDFDRAAQEVVRLMLLLIRPLPRRIPVVHAYDLPYGGMVYPSLSEDEASGEKSELQVEATERLAKLLAATLTRLGVPAKDAPSWKLHVRYGSPHVVVERVMKRADTDLLLLGSRGFSLAAQVFLGTVAGDLLRDAKCDVLVVPPAAGR